MSKKIYVKPLSETEQTLCGMQSDVVDALVEKMANQREKVEFCFCGVEPLQLSINYYKYFCEKATALLKDVSFSIETNGELLDSEWCDLFKQYSFCVGLFVDGYKSLHQANKALNDKTADFFFVEKALALLNKTQVNFHAITLLTNKTQLKKLLEFFQKNRITKVRFEFLSGESNLALSQEDFCNLSLELSKDGLFEYVYPFDEVKKHLQKQQVSCEINGICQGKLTFDWQGNLYPCIHFATEQWRCCSIQDYDQNNFYKNEMMKAFIKLSYKQNAQCLSCNHYYLCKGGCLNERKSKTLPIEFCQGKKALLDALCPKD